MFLNISPVNWTQISLVKWLLAATLELTLPEGWFHSKKLRFDQQMLDFMGGSWEVQPAKVVDLDLWDLMVGT
jgi:hypothetical protein